MAAQENWWDSSPVVAKPNQVQQVPGGIYVPPAPEKPEKPQAPPSGYRFNAQGGLEFIPGGPADPNAPKSGDAKPTEAQSKVFTLLSRIAGGASTIKDVVAVEPEAQQAGLFETLSRNVLGEGIVTRSLAGPERRTVTDAQVDILDGLLTLGTGAAYNREQLIGQTLSYFPQYGDTKQEIEVKNQRLNRAIEAARIQAGPLAEEFDNVIKPLFQQAAAAAAPEAGPRGVPALEVAQGDRIATDRDIEIASLLQGAWQSGKSIDEINALTIQLGTEPLPPETIEALRSDPNRQIRFTPNRSGVREGAGPGMGAAAAAGSIRGLTGNLAEEALALVSPESAAKLQAAGEFAQQQYPLTTMAGEVIGGALSPLSRVGPGGTIAGEAVRGGIYGGLYGAGEAAPDAAIMERVLPAVVGLTTGAGTGALAQRFLGRAGEAMPAPDGGVVPPVAGVVPEVPAAGMAAPVEAVAPPVAAVAPEEAAAQIGSEEMINLAQKAISRGPGASKARAQLAEMAKTNPEAKTAADRLGLELPVDVLSDNSQLKEVVGLTRAQIGSEAKQAWNETVQAASDRAHAAMDELDAVTDISQVSADVFNRLDNAQNSLGRQASDLRQEVTNAVDVRGRVDATGIKSWLQTRIDDLGGGKEGVAALSPEEKRLWGVVSKAAKTPSISDVVDYATSKGIRLDLSERGGKISLNIIDTTKAGRGSGLGTDVMNKLINAADAEGKTITLTPDTSFGASSKKRLQDFYKRFGFVDNKGGNRDFEISDDMYRIAKPFADKASGPTYALINEQRDLIGQALERGTGPWSNTNMKRLKDIYGALADDQIKFIEASAGKEIADKQRAANTLFKQMYEGREQMERIFTKNLSGSLAPLMQRAITQGTKGNVQTLNTLVSIIPEDMRGKVLTSALFKAAKATDDTFSFTNFANIYRDLRANGEVYKQIAKAVGPEGDKLLTDLYAVSRRLSDADKAISRTGASTQLNLLNSERLLSRILMASGGAAGAGLIGSVLGGPGAAIIGAGLAAAAPEIAQRVGKTNAQKLHNLISSEPFRDLTVSAATGDALDRNINRVAGSKQFRDYAKMAGIDMKDARNWLNSAISKGATIAATETTGPETPMAAPTVEMPQ